MRARTMTLLICLSLITLAVLPASASSARPIEPKSIAATSSASSITFIENVGQFPADVRYYVQGLGRAVWLTDDGVWLAVAERVENAPARIDPPARYAPYDQPARSPGIPMPGRAWQRDVMPTDRDARPTPNRVTVVKISYGSMTQLESLNHADTIVNFYRTADPATWHTAVPVWHSVRYADVAPGVDLVLQGEGSSLRWQFACEGECDQAVRDLVPHIEGAANVTIEDDRIVVDAETDRVEVARPAAPDDNPAALIAGTFLGGDDLDSIKAITLGGDGSVYVTGYTGSSNLSEAASLSPGTHLLADGEGTAAFVGPIFVAKFTSDLGAASRRYLTFIGTEYQDYDTIITESGNDIDVDAQGNAYIAGETASRVFPTTPGAYDRTLNNGSTSNCPTGWLSRPCPDAFVVKLNATGALVYGTYFGGSQMIVPGLGNSGGNDFGYGIHADAQGRIYLSGETNSDDLPTTSGAYDRDFSYIDIGLNTDIFVAKINPAGQGAADVLYSTYVGAGFPNKFGGLDLDAAGRVYVTGQVQGRSGFVIPPYIDFPRTPNAYPATSQCLAYDCADVFFFKLNPANGGQSDLLYGTFFGGAAPATSFFEYEAGYDVAVDAAGAAYLVGRTDAPDYPTTPGALMRSAPNGSTLAIFVSKLNPLGGGASDLVYSTYFGGDWDSEAHAVALGSDGHVYLTGNTLSTNFPFTRGALMTRKQGARDAFLVRLNLAGQGVSDLVYSTYLGGYNSDYGYDLAVDGSGLAYVAGQTDSSDFPVTPGAYDPDFDTTACGSYMCGDGYIAKIATGYTTIEGRVRDALNQPIANVTVTARTAARTAANTAQTTTDANGGYSFNQLLPGTYTVTVTGNYFWTPAQRTISAPPDAASQDFVGSRILKASALNRQTPAPYGTLITYTLKVIAPNAGNFRVMDAVPTHTTYVSGSVISLPAGATYEATANAISGTLNLSAGQVATVTFTAQVAITPTAVFGPSITNRACVTPAGGATCEWSNEVINFTRLSVVYLPIVWSNHAADSFHGALATWRIGTRP